MKIILLSYLSRSGSTLICDLLIKDERFCVCPEAEILTRILLRSPQRELTTNTYKKLINATSNDPKLKYWNIKIPEKMGKHTNITLFVSLLDQYRQKLKPKSKYVVFKSEELETFDINLVKNFYKIILFRDPRAIFLSQKISTPSTGIGKMNLKPKRLVLKMNRIINSFDIHEVRMTYVTYERFLTNRNTEIDKILVLLNIKSLESVDNDNSILSILPNNQKHLHKNIKKKSMLTSIDKWKNYLSNYEIDVIQRYYKDTLDLGYEPHLVTVTLSEKIKYSLSIMVLDTFNKLIRIKSKIFK